MLIFCYTTICSESEPKMLMEILDVQFETNRKA